VSDEKPKAPELSPETVKRRAETLATLRAGGVTQATCEYNGSGDEGQIDEIALFDDDDDDPIDDAGPEEADVQDFFYALLGDIYGSWGDNLGSAGKVTWYIDTDTIKIDHGWRVEHYEDDNTMLPAPKAETEKGDHGMSKRYAVKVTRVTEYLVTADSEQEAIDFALEEDPRAESQGGADDAIAAVITA